MKDADNMGKAGGAGIDTGAFGAGAPRVGCASARRGDAVRFGPSKRGGDSRVQSGGLVARPGLPSGAVTIGVAP